MSTRRFRSQAEANAYDLGLADARQKVEPLSIEAIKAMPLDEAKERITEINQFMANPVAATGGDDNDE